LKRKSRAVLFALSAALLFGVQAPFAKLLVDKLDELFFAALLYLGAGLGMMLVKAVEMRVIPKRRERSLEKKDLPFVIMMIVLDIAAPILLLIGLKMSSAGTASLLGNFEIVATSLLAMMFFREMVGIRLWISIFLITIASLILSIGSISDIQWSPGALLILMASIVWGLENNCTRSLSGKDPLQIVIIKGCGSGLGSLVLACIFGTISGNLMYIFLAMGLGFIAYGLSIFFYVKAQRELGAARTSAFYAAAPFIGVLLSWMVLREKISGTFLMALGLMLVGSVFMLSEKHSHQHVHLQEQHEHMHSHMDGHHNHPHNEIIMGEHSHMHTHEYTVHQHPHTPDTHHRHSHG